MTKTNPATPPSAGPIRRHQLATVHETASYVGVSPKTIRRWIASGLLVGYAAGPRLIRLDLDEVDSMLARSEANGHD
jgi:excisionase family DNA binding protein